MTPEININLIIAFIGIAVSVAAFIYGRSTAARQDGKQDGTILSELGYLKANTDEIKRRIDKQDERDRDYISRMAAVESSCKSAHIRLDQMCNRHE